MRANAVVTSIGASLALAAALSLGPPASALVVTDSVERFRTFSGDGCETPTVESVPLPRGAGRIVATRPKAGAVLRDVDTGETEVARISSVRTRRQGGRRIVEFAAVGSGTACADPSAAVAWETDFVSLVARFRRRVRVYLAGTDGRPRRRPAIAYIGASQRIYGLRWASWGRRRARARGMFPANSCIPSCAEGTIVDRPVAVTLSQPRLCRGRYRYLVLRYRFLDGGGRPGRTTFGYQC